ncbi:MAG: phosphatase PAP2 family protein [Bacteroidota bacterium]
MNYLLRIGLVAMISFWSIYSGAQSPYKFSWKGDGLVGGIGLTILGGSVLINKKVQPITEEEWKQLTRDDVWAFDRVATTREWANKGAKARKLSDALLMSSVMLPFAASISRGSSGDFRAAGLLSLETMVINVGLTNLTKGLVKRKRPYTYNHEEVPWEIMRKQNLLDSRRSFFSGHTSVSSSMYVLGAKMYSDFNPNSDLRPVVWTTAFVIPAITGWMRVRGGKHYPTDVITGFLVGSAVGFLVPHFHKE